MVDLQLRAGAIPEPTFLWWDVRPQPRFGTVEVRIMDAQSRLAETAALAGFVQAIARLELEEGYVSEESVAAEEVLAENRFLAARDGVDARLIDTCSQSLRSIEAILDDLLVAARPHAAALHCVEQLDWIPALAVAPGAARQRSCPPDEPGLTRMVRRLAAVFTE